MIQPLGLSQVSTHRQPFAVLHCEVHREVEVLLSWVKANMTKAKAEGGNMMLMMLNADTIEARRNM